MGVRNRALMGAEHPSFQQRDRAMDARKQVFSGLLMPLNLAIVNVSLHSEVGGKAVGSNRASRHNGLSDESMESGPGRIRDTAQANAANALSIFFGGDGDQGLEFGPPAVCARFLAAPVGLVHLNDAIKSRSRPGRTMARRSLCNIAQAVL